MTRLNYQRSKAHVSKVWDNRTPELIEAEVRAKLAVKQYNREQAAKRKRKGK